MINFKLKGPKLFLTKFVGAKFIYDIILKYALEICRKAVTWLNYLYILRK